MNRMRVADQAWVAIALLHREHPERNDFTLEEIVRRAEQEFGHLQAGVRQHIVSHGVAQNEPRPARLRMFTKTERSKRRLFREADSFNPRRTGRTHPNPNHLEQKYKSLVDWYLYEYAPNGNSGSPATASASSSPRAFLAFIGLIPAYDLNIMRQTIEQECERVENDSSETGVA